MVWVRGRWVMLHIFIKGAVRVGRQLDVSQEQATEDYQKKHREPLAKDHQGPSAKSPWGLQWVHPVLPTQCGQTFADNRKMEESDRYMTFHWGCLTSMGKLTKMGIHVTSKLKQCMRHPPKYWQGTAQAVANNSSTKGHGDRQRIRRTRTA